MKRREENTKLSRYSEAKILIFKSYDEEHIKKVEKSESDMPSVGCKFSEKEKLILKLPTNQAMKNKIM